MQLDRTRIAIRPRSSWELLDLALRVAWTYRGRLLVSALPLALVFALINAYLLHEIVADEYTAETNYHYVTMMGLLVFLEAPWATLPTTQVLGRIMFSQDVTWRSVLRELGDVAGRILWTQGLFRGGFLLILVAWQATRDRDWNSGVVGFLVLLVGYSALLRAFRPFINEIVLLERNPLRKTHARTVTIGRRTQTLHSADSGDLLGRWLMGAAASAAFTLSLVGSMWFILGMISNQWAWGATMVKVAVPAALWLSVVFSCVFRFLGYIDLRIRREGWEVELYVRAAADELRGQTA